MPRRSLNLGNIITPELGLLSPNRNEIAPRGKSREAALIAYSERLRNSYKQNDFGLKDGMVMLGEAFRNGQSISITCFCRAGQTCHADVVKLAIEKVAKAIDARELDRASRHSPAREPSFRPSNPRTERAINEILSFSKSDLLLSRLDDTNGLNQSEHASYLNGQNQVLRDLYERGGTVKDGILIIPKEIQELKSPLRITTQEYGVKRLEPVIGLERSRDVVPQILEYGKAIAGGGADRETEAKVFRWIYDALDGKQEFLEESKDESRTESIVERFERTLDDVARLAEEMSRLEPSDHSIEYEAFDESYIPGNDHALSEGLEEVSDRVVDLESEQNLEHVHSTLGFERVELESTSLNQLAAEMSTEEFQHWAQVRLPALDDALENGINPSITLKLLKARVEKGIQKGTEAKALSLEDLRFASAYLEHQLKQPETRLRHFNERYRDYAQMLDRCQSREEVIDASSRIRIENASARTHAEQKGQHHDSKSLSALTSKELQMLFTEPSPRHYTSEMIVAKLNYAGDGASRNAKTEALLKGEIEPGPEARKLVDSLESRMGRKYIDESLAATRHFLQSLKTPNEELRYKNSFDHSDLYRKLPPSEKDFVYQRATEQKNRLLSTSQKFSDQHGLRTDIPVGQLQDAMKAELLASSLSNFDPGLVKDRASRILEEYLGDRENDLVRLKAGQLSQELSEIVLGRNSSLFPDERTSPKMNASQDGDHNSSSREMWLERSR
ncbi:MAG TPA: hypothetical protein PKD26_16655 [Pyrinomonadaceae bacterium]|nr:hypothetical protein [Pyrinomonadaceae bacterium]